MRCPCVYVGLPVFRTFCLSISRSSSDAALQRYAFEFLPIRLRHAFDMLIDVMGHWAAVMQEKDPTKPLSEVAALANDRYSSEAGT